MKYNITHIIKKINKMGIEHIFGTKNLIRSAAMSYEDDISTSSECIAIEVKNMFVRIQVFDTGIIIAIRGTDGFADWLFNVSRMRGSFINNTKVHMGYLWSLNTVYPQIQSIIAKKMEESRRNIYVTGHSLGGAVGLLCAVKLADEYPECGVHMTSIGAPRVGNKKFKVWCENRENLSCIRIFNPKDIVPKLPYFGYYHFGTPYKVKSKTPFYRILSAHSIHKYLDNYVS